MKHPAQDTDSSGETLDAIVIGAGFAGLGMLRKLRDIGLNATIYESGAGVGGTWYWNRYPGARTDCEHYYYCFQSSDDLLQDWSWTERYAGQPEVRKYLEHVADRFDLRRDIQLETRIVAARYDEDTATWTVTTEHGDRVRARLLISATGILSIPTVPEFTGLDTFSGDTYLTANWPESGVDLTGKRVAIIGTGATGVQLLPAIAEDTAHVFMMQRTPNYVVPAQNFAVTPDFEKSIKGNYTEILDLAREHSFALPIVPPGRNALDVSPEERQRIYEEGWQNGGFRFLFETFDDLLTDPEANETAAEFIRSKIREIVTDPEVAEKLCPTGYPYGGKRPPVGTNYYETFNRDDVTLVDIRQDPIVEITPRGIRTGAAEYEGDVIVLATGFDAITGALERIEISGRAGTLSERWTDGPSAYLGLATADFPNLLMITGPTAPFCNIPSVIELNIEWIARIVEQMRDNNWTVVEADEAAEQEWNEFSNTVASMTLVPQGEQVNSWLTGANIEGKPRGLSLFMGGYKLYSDRCDELVANGYKGFNFSAG